MLLGELNFAHFHVVAGIEEVHVVSGPTSVQTTSGQVDKVFHPSSISVTDLYVPLWERQRWAGKTG